MSTTAELSPTLAATLHELRDLCDDPIADDPDPATRYGWLTRVPGLAAEVNEQAPDKRVAEHDAGRPIDGLAFEVAVTAEINAAANVGAFLSDPRMADIQDPVIVDVDSYALAVMTVARFLELDDEVGDA